jgi:bacterioferritin-associated ferredoxin
MYVCLCEGVTDTQIRDAVYEGCCSYREVRGTLGIASQCGKCACLAKQVAKQHWPTLPGSSPPESRPRPRHKKTGSHDPVFLCPPFS